MKLKPEELTNPKYYAHLVLIVVILFGLLYLFKFGNMISWYNLFVSTIFLLIADITAHTVMRLD